MRPEGTLQPRPRWGVVPPRVIRKVPVNGRESVNEHGLRAIGRRAFVRAAHGDQAIAHRAAADRAPAARPRLGERAQVVRRGCLRSRLDREPCPRRPAHAAHVHVTLLAVHRGAPRRARERSLLTYTFVPITPRTVRIWSPGRPWTSRS